MLPETVHQIHGFLDPTEMELLYRLASEVPPGGVIVEIGSYQGKSTVCLGLGAKAGGAKVWAIDPHDDCQVNSETRYGMENHAALLRNLTEFDLGETVRVVAMKSHPFLSEWTRDQPIDLLWIDGSHQYFDVQTDLDVGSFFMGQTGKIAVHDSSGHFPDVNRALDEFIKPGRWKAVERVAVFGHS